MAWWSPPGWQRGCVGCCRPPADGGRALTACTPHLFHVVCRLPRCWAAPWPACTSSCGAMPSGLPTRPAFRQGGVGGWAEGVGCCVAGHGQCSMQGRECSSRAPVQPCSEQRSANAAPSARPCVVQAAAALCAARRERGLAPFWPSVLATLTGYEQDTHQQVGGWVGGWGARVVAGGHCRRSVLPPGRCGLPKWRVEQLSGLLQSAVPASFTPPRRMPLPHPACSSQKRCARCSARRSTAAPSHRPSSLEPPAGAPARNEAPPAQRLPHYRDQVHRFVHSTLHAPTHTHTHTLTLTLTHEQHKRVPRTHTTSPAAYAPRSGSSARRQLYLLLREPIPPLLLLLCTTTGAATPPRRHFQTAPFTPMRSSHSTRLATRALTT